MKLNELEIKIQTARKTIFAQYMIPAIGYLVHQYLRYSNYKEITTFPICF